MKQTFTQYLAEDFAAEETFIAWVLSDFRKNHREWSQWLASHPDRLEEVERAKHIVQILRIQRVDHDTDTDALWQRIDASISVETKSKRGLIRYLVPVISAAACFALLLILNPFSSGYEQVTSQYAESITFKLPDHSRVQLNAGSHIEYAKDNWESDRHVELDGEAYFEVIPGERFAVETDIGLIEVLGTKFNVYSRDGTFEVICSEGRVLVTVKKSEQQVELGAGERVLLTAAGMLEKSRQMTAVIDWLTDTYTFDGVPLSEVFDEIERQYNVEVEVPDHARTKLYSGSFKKGDLDQALYDICWPMGLSSNVKGNSVEILIDPPE